MAEWSDVEATRTVEEIKRRSLIDPEFRALALSNPVRAIAQVNPKPLPKGYSVRFVETTTADVQDDSLGAVKTVVLPDAIARIAELSDAELDQAAGGDGPTPKLRTA